MNIICSVASPQTGKKIKIFNIQYWQNYSASLVKSIICNAHFRKCYMINIKLFRPHKQVVYICKLYIFVLGGIMRPLPLAKDVHTLNVRSYEHVTLNGKRDFADMIILKDLEMGKLS